MEYTTLSDGKRMNGTSRQGLMQIEYSELVRVFGEPRDRSGICGDGKTQAQWIIEATYHDWENSLEIATVYDYKEYSKEPKDITLWHIGGFDKEAVSIIRTVLEQNHAKYELPS